ncbi:hypothetical protein Tco_0896298 [Tanacetum coccineum]
MDNPNITMEEYIQLEAEKACRRGKDFNWETTTYGKVGYFEDIDYFKDFENEFLAIVYEDAFDIRTEVSSEPTNENDDFGEVFIFWNSECCNHAVIIENMVKVSEKARILEHKHFDELKDHCLTLKNTPYPHQRYTGNNTFVNKEEQAGFTQYAISIKNILRIRALNYIKDI